MKEATKQVLKGAILNCGLATGLINAIISNFTLPKEQGLLLSDLTMNFALTAFGCGLLCPFFGTIILKAVAGKKQIAFGEKDDHIFAKYVPNNLFAGAIVIALMATISLWLLPWIIISLLHVDVYLVRIGWIVMIGLYSAISAAFGAYFGMHRVHYATQMPRTVME